MQVDTLGRTYIIHHTSYMSAHGLSTGGVAAGSGVWVHIIVFILVGSYDRMMWGACMDGGHHCLPCCRRSTLLAHTLNTHTQQPSTSLKHTASFLHIASLRNRNMESASRHDCEKWRFRVGRWRWQLAMSHRRLECLSGNDG
jgi:hypothetical protein